MRQYPPAAEQWKKPEQRLEQRRLPRAIGTEDAQRRSRPDREIERRQQRGAVPDHRAFEADQFQGASRYQSGGAVSTPW